MPKREKSGPYVSLFFVTVNTNQDYRAYPEIFNKLKSFMKNMTSKANITSYLTRNADDKISKIRSKHIAAVGNKSQIHTHLLLEVTHSGKSLRFNLNKLRDDVMNATGLPSIYIDKDILRAAGQWNELADYIDRNV